MTEPPRRKRFQIHLSTAIVLMFVAGGLIWANRIEKLSTSRIEFAEYTHAGWPFWALNHIHLIDPYGIERIGKTDMYFIVYPGLIENLSVAALILFSVWFLCEWLIRRRAARKDA
jgi:hypothetical protein